MENSTSTALETINIDKIQGIIAKAPLVLEQNRESRENAIKAYESLKQLAESNGMSDNLEVQLARYVKKSRDTVKVLNERRKPFTQMVDALKKEFTGIENDLKAAGDDLQKYRDSYAAEKMAEQRERERQAALKMAAEKEKIRVKTEMESKLSENYLNYVSDVKNKMYNMLENATLETIEQVKDKIYKLKPDFSPEKYNSIEPKVAADSTLIGKQEYDNILTDVMDDVTFETIKADFSKSILAYRKELLDKIPSKMEELKEIAKANQAEREQMESEAKKRREDEQERIRQEAEAEKRRKSEDANAKAAGELLEATAANQAEIDFEDSPRVKENVEIIVKRTAGYALIFQFWFEKEGKSLPAEKIERKTVKQMKSFCESYTLKTGEIINSPFIEYKDVYKAR